ncbi:hypothetical protein Ccrd_016918 [Cynara cardunculus var. scolymus]|uniref:LIM-domain binding protein/SEUSS n=1 Tax=Cynara cardunculus var. scolymus TaxID=59895 RepID=A0A103Y924_CYNCS|nr:hypothetical protein Ccrd_016918 [Cynara cardunculus var. scolymus]
MTAVPDNSSQDLPCQRAIHRLDQILTRVFNAPDHRPIYQITRVPSTNRLQPVSLKNLALENYLDSSQQSALPRMGPSRAGVGMVHSSSSSGIFFQGDMQSQALGNSHLGSFGNSANSIPGNMRPNMVPISGDISNTVMSSGPSIGASSLVTDANSGLSGGGPRLQRSASANNESYMRLPASPLSFSSNNISISGSSVIDGPSALQQSSNQDPHLQQVQQQPGPRQGASTATSLPPPRIGQVSLPNGSRVPGSFIQDNDNISHLQKKPRLDIKQEDMMQQQDNGISYWRKFVAEYYSPRAKKRWCLSLYDNVGHHSLGVFPQAAMDAWQCDICGSKSGRGFEATFEVLPRLSEIKFGSGVIDELLFLDLPREYRFPSGIMVLEYGQAVQESIYEQLRVVREGQLKILTWEFCARRHEELLPRRLVAPQVNQLLQVAQKCQSTIAESGSDGISQQDLQTNSNMVVTAGRQLARSLELQSLNDLGFSKRYVRCLQISEVVNSMKDLMDFCRDTKAGPIEGLKNFPRQTSAAKSQMLKMQEMEQLSSIQGLPADRNALSKLVSMHPGLNGPLSNNSHHMGSQGAGISGSAQAALAHSNYQNMLMRQNSMNSNSQQEASSSFNNSSQNGYLVQSSANMLQQRPMFQVQQNHQQSPSNSSSQALQQHMIQQLLQDMNNGGGSGGGGGAKPSVSGQSGASGSMGREGLRYGISSSGTSPRPPAVPTRSNSFKGATRSDSSAGGGGNVNQKASDVAHLCDDIVQDIGSEFTGNGFFDNDELEEGMGMGMGMGMGYGWKG